MYDSSVQAYARRGRAKTTIILDTDLRQLLIERYGKKKLSERVNADVRAQETMDVGRFMGSMPELDENALFEMRRVDREREKKRMEALDA